MKAGIGIDPGLTESGAVAIDDNDENVALAWATFSCTDTCAPDLTRVLSLASEIVDTLVRWVDELGITRLDISIELPILKKGKYMNPLAYAKQNRLIQEIESGIFYRVAPELQECWVTEVYPSTSKAMATNHGGATKDEILAVSPFKDLKLPIDTKRTVADAWAHGLCTWKGAAKPASRTNFSALEVPEVKHGKNGSPI